MTDLTLAQALRLRSLAFGVVADFFRARGFVEVDAPLLLPAVPVESFVDVFQVPLRRQGRAEVRFLPPSPEASLKRALAILGAPCFELGHAFRDGEEEGLLHRAHFRMLEWYRTEADWRDVMADTVDLFRALAGAFAGQDIAPLPPPPVDIHGPWEELEVPEALARYAGVSVQGPEDLRRLPEIVRARGLARVDTWQDAFCVLLAMEVEPHLGRGRPTLLTAYPAGLASQARPMADRPWLAEQFEVWVEGIELGNSYSEVTDASAQRRRVAEEQARFRASGREPPPVDEAWLRALERLPERCAGGSVGVDRTLMMFLGVADIGRVRL